MSRILEIPPIEDVKKLPVGNRAWMYVVISDCHDASLQLRCEGIDGKEIAGANVEMRTRTGEGGFSYHTANAIADIACASSSLNEQLSVGEEVWRAAERKNGIIFLSRPSDTSLIMTIVDIRGRCSVILSPELAGQDVHRIKTDQNTFERFLRLGGAMKSDWGETGDMLEKYSKLAFDEAGLQSDLI